MGAKHFTDEQIADFLSQAKDGVSNKVLCEKYNFSTSTLRRWKELHDESIRNELKKMESTSATIFLCLILINLILTGVLSKAVGGLCIPLILGHCIFYIIRFRKKSSGFIISEYVFLSRSGRGESNAFYRFS
ncbi:transposase [Serratia sp. 2723]|uniref:transposase n=1 Tax=unclassified Serratia (in: enterobacteria) TaxID=2647522 RepID=UPI003D222692